MKKSIIIIITVIMLSASAAHPQMYEKFADRSFSPYIAISGGADDGKLMQLNSTSVEVNIAGVYAEVSVSQYYINNTKDTVDAVYTYPASSNVLINSLKAETGNRKISAEIRNKNKISEKSVPILNIKNSASYYEFTALNPFRMNVPRIAPGAGVSVSLKYSEELAFYNGSYNFEFPAALPAQNPVKTMDDYESVPVLLPDSSSYAMTPEKPHLDFNIEVYISAGMTIQNVSSSSHQIIVTYPDSNSAFVKFDSLEVYGGEIPFSLQFQLQGKVAEPGMVLYDANGEKYFMLTVQPPLSPTDIPGGEYVFLLDASASMSGFPLTTAKKLIGKIVDALDTKDKFNVITFTGTPAMLSDTWLSPTPENISNLEFFTAIREGSSEYNLLAALKKALNLPHNPEAPRSYFLITDGNIYAGKEEMNLLHNSLNQANFYVAGIGSSVNIPMLKSLANTGADIPMIITDPDMIMFRTDEFVKYVKKPLITNLKIKYGKFGVYDVLPDVLPDILAERPLVITGKYKGSPTGTISISGNQGSKTNVINYNVSRTFPDSLNEALRYQWAAKYVKNLEDSDRVVLKKNERIKLISETGLMFNIPTVCTDFVSVDRSETTDKNGAPLVITKEFQLPAHATDSDINQLPEDYDMMMQNIYGAVSKLYKEIIIPSLLEGETKKNIYDDILSGIEKDFKDCKPKMNISFKIKVNVKADGAVRDVVFEDILVNDNLAECIKKAVKGWNFAKYKLTSDWFFNIRF